MLRVGILRGEGVRGRELLSFGVSGAKVGGLALPTGVFERNGMLSWEWLDSSRFIMHNTALK